MDDCCCTVEDTDTMAARVHRIVRQLEGRAFFRFYRVNLAKTCPFWKTDGACLYQSCAVAACTEEELPLGLRRVSGGAADCDEAAVHGALTDTVR